MIIGHAPSGGHDLHTLLMGGDHWLQLALVFFHLATGINTTNYIVW